MLEEELEKKNVSRDTFQSLTHVQLFGTPRTIALQALLSMGFSSKNTGVGCHALLQGIFLTQGLNSYLLCLLH